MQFELNKLARKECLWLEEKAQLQTQLTHSHQRLEHFSDVEAQLRAEISRLQTSPLLVDIDALNDQITIIQRSVDKWRIEERLISGPQQRSVRPLIEGGERKITRLKNELENKQQRLHELKEGANELKVKIETLSGLVAE